jgi:hypothetical protein
MMTVLSFVVVALLGLGTISAMISGAHAAQNNQNNTNSDTKPARWQVSDSR